VTLRETLWFCLGGKSGLAAHKLTRAQKYIRRDRQDLYIRVVLGTATESEKLQHATTQEAVTLLWKLGWVV